MMNEAVHHASTTYQQPSFNRIFLQIFNASNLLASEKTASFKEYLENLDATSETNYSLWRAARNLKRPVEFKPPYAIQVRLGTKIVKGNLFADHLKTFHPKRMWDVVDLPSIVSSPPHPVTFEFREVQNVIANLNPKKAPVLMISNKMMIELPRVATINLALDDNMVLLNKRIDWFKS
ncbi:RNA-directed DNA polymerase from mobile element jockey [Eumeta japonica]|uniref:RNA-directed DNA polymerase from mobile element jockey n=1 Tax=Eumeta variegata TaxID=151549 RepID=A0A4C1T9D1_EUMVA|nr:RNA-directed DNA polymerase from mobile element jockey [Eumeta japonica]